MKKIIIAAALLVSVTGHSLSGRYGSQTEHPEPPPLVIDETDYRPVYLNPAGFILNGTPVTQVGYSRELTEDEVWKALPAFEGLVDIHEAHVSFCEDGKFFNVGLDLVHPNPVADKYTRMSVVIGITSGGLRADDPVVSDVFGVPVTGIVSVSRYADGTPPVIAHYSAGFMLDDVWYSIDFFDSAEYSERNPNLEKIVNEIIHRDTVRGLIARYADF
jgi:hypothetical protein